VCHDFGVLASGLDQIPHDLWDECEFPALSLSEFLTLALNGFDKTFEIQVVGCLRIVDIPWQSTIRREYSVRNIDSSRIADLERLLGEKKISPAASGVVVSGTVRDHAAVERWIAANQQSTAIKAENNRPGRKVYSLTIKNQPVQPVIEGLARQLGLTVQFDESIDKKKRMQRISFTVVKGSSNEVLQAALSAAGLAYSIRGNTLAITPSGAHANEGKPDPQFVPPGGS
jgi:hypothetical protein